MKIRHLILLLIMIGGVWPQFCRALPPGALLYRTGADGKMFGYSGDPLMEIEGGILKGVNAGHVAVYIGKVDGEDYVVEAMGGGIVRTPARYFINEAAGEVFLGAKIPAAADKLQQARAVALAKSLADRKLSYDFDFKHQKGPGDGDWTCVGLTEKIYESADIPNPNNLAALEYDQSYYALDITPDGFDDKSAPDSAGDRFSRVLEFSQIARRDRMLIPLPELIGFDAGLEQGGKRYIFLPYTQFLQPTLAPLKADIDLSSSFSDESVRGPLSAKSLALRWSLINNPLSSVKAIAVKTKEAVLSVWRGIFGTGSGTGLVLDDGAVAAAPGQSRREGNPSEGDSAARPLNPAVVRKNTEIGKASAGASETDLSLFSGSDGAVSTKGPDREPAVKVNTRSSGGAEEDVAAAVYDLPAAPAPSASVPTPVAAPAVTRPAATVNVNNNPTGNSGNTSADDAPRLARINRIYATRSDDWIELYNPTAYDFDLAEAGYRLEKAKTVEDPSLIMRIGNAADGTYPRGTVIRAHGRYLIVRADAGPYYKNKADAIATRTDFNWNGSGYTIYLGLDAISSSADPDIMEAVGFGSDATYFQGSSPASAITDNFILSRVAAAGDNRTDFNLVVSDDPNIVWNPASGEEGANDDAPVEGADTASSTPAAPLILINKIYATEGNDWLELFNFGDHDFDLAAGAYRLEKTKTAQDPSLAIRFGNLEDGAYPGGTLIKAHDKYLVVRDDANPYYLSQADAIVSRDEFGWTGQDYTVYLGRDAISSSTDPDILDAVGFGSGATYFAGTRSAPEIPDGFMLNRIGQSGDNHADFNLIASDDPGLATSSEETATDGFFITPPIESAGLSEVLHFDECYGIGSWAVGRWDCAKEIGYRTDKLSYKLASAADLNSFSFSFQYKKYSEFPRLSLLFSNAAGDKLDFTLDPGLVTVEGLPASDWRYYLDIPFDDTWHQAALVVDQNSDYWAVYIDGIEMIRESFLARLPSLTDLEVSGTNGSALIDEIAIWSRPLGAAELRSDFLSAAPFSPLAPRPSQAAAQLKHLWKFEEDAGSVAQDSIGAIQLAVSTDAWVGRSHDNYALRVSYPSDFLAPLNFSFAPTARDLSIAFWWRNSAYPDLGRIIVALLRGEDKKKIFVLSNDYLRSSFWFNENYGVFLDENGPPATNDDAWHHLAMTYDSYRYRLTFYVDGVEKAWRPFIWIKDETEISQLSVSSDNFSSEIDDLGFWEGALSAAQVREVYDASK